MADFDFTVKLKDAYTRTSTKRYQISAADFAAAQAAVAAYIVDLKNLTEAEILETKVSQSTVETDTVVPGANLDEGITMTFLKQDNQNATVKVPAPVNSVINADGSVNTADALVVAWAAHFINGPIYVSDLEIATELVSGKLDR